MAFRSLLQNMSCQVAIRDNQFTAHELIFTVSPTLPINNAEVPQNEISYVPAFNQSYDETYVGPFTLRIQPDSNRQKTNNIFTIYISLDEQREPYGNLLEAIREKDNYKKMRNSKLLSSKIGYSLLPEPHEFFSGLDKIKQILLAVNQHNIAYPIDQRDRIESGWENINANVQTQIASLVETHFKNFHDVQMKLNKSLEKFNQYLSTPEDIKKQINQLAHRQSTSVFNQEAIIQLKNELIGIVQSNISVEILKKLTTGFEQHNQTLDDASQWLLLKHLVKIIEALKKSRLLNDININYICAFFQGQNRAAHEYIQHLQFVNSQIQKINQCGLLTQEIFNDVFAGKKYDYSSQGRLKGFGLDSVKSVANQQRWGYYSKAIVENLLHMMEDKKSLHEMLNYAAFMRQKIAMVEGVKQFEQYGLLRTGLGISGDKYRNQSSEDFPSVLDPNLFPNIVNIVDKFILNEAYKTKTVDSTFIPPGLFNNTNYYEVELSRISKHNINIPKEFITIVTKENKEIFCVSTKCARIEKEQWNEAIDQLNDIYLKKLQQKHLEIDVDPLREICELVGHLVDFYPYMRGSGAILKFFMMSMLQFHYGKNLDEELNDLRINNIPFDVYAQLTTLEEFVTELYKNIKPLLSKTAKQTTIKKM